MSKDPKLDKKQLKQPDEFVKSGTSLVGFFVRQKSRFLGVLILLVVSVIVAYTWDWYQATRLDTSWAEFDAIEADSDKEQIEAFKSFYENQPNLRPRYLAALSIADFYFDRAKNARLGVKSDAKNEEEKTGENSDAPETADAPVDAKAEAALAAQWYQKAMEFSELLPFEKQLLWVDLSKSYEIQGDLQKALEPLQRASEEAGEGKPLALLSQGRIHQMMGDREAAQRLFERVSTEFVDTEFGNLAKAYMRAMESEHFKSDDQES